MKEKNKSPNLALISNHVPEKRRIPRLNLTREQFRLGRNGKIFAVVDLSIGGMALKMIEQEDFSLFPVGTRFEGTLNLSREKFPVSCEVRHIGREAIGCQFVDLPKQTHQAIEAFFNPERLGAELAPLPSDEEGLLWYHGPTGADLLLRRGMDGQFYRITLYLFGSFVQWEDTHGLTTGKVSSSHEKSEDHGLMRLETMLLSADDKLDLSKLKIAKTVIMSSNLPQDLKRWCERQLDYGS